MPEPKVIITRACSEELRDKAQGLALDLTCVKTLETVPVQWKFVPSQSSNECWCITSRNAVAAFLEAHALHGTQCAIVACVGPQTAEMLENAGVKPAVVGDSASELVSNLPWDKFDTMRFFCGSTRRPDIPKAVADRSCPYFEQIVYHSNPVFPVVDPNGWDCVICTSPRSAMSLMRRNKFPPAQLMMAMGAVTKTALLEMGFADILVASRPDLMTIFQELSNYLKNA